MRQQSVSVIMYHYVRELKNSRYPQIKGMEYSLFKQQVAYIKKNYTCISAEELIAAFDEGDKLPDNAILLTFDDGYIDHFNYVFPFLHQHGIKACFYTPVQAIRERKFLDVNKIHYIVALAKDEDQLVKMLHEEMDILRKDFELEDNDTYWKLYAKAILDTPKTLYFKRMLQDGLQGEARARALDAIFTRIVDEDESVLAAELYLNEDQMRCMMSNGMHIGIHGSSHTRLHTLTAEDQEKEISESMDFMRSVGADMNTLTICYPYGSYNEDTKRISAEKGCRFGLTVDPGIVYEVNPLTRLRFRE
jgi:peptidoglycan/xylan/chitin deacetylase (PgdA/CDA1 family)